MLRIGLTGGIGAGKSAVADLFRAVGASIIDADEVARALAARGGDAYGDIVAQFGEDILAPNKEIDRARLRRRVFGSREERKRLEAIMHPKVRKAMLERLARIDAPYAVLVIPLLVETGAWDIVDRVLVIDADEEVRIARVKTRGLGEEDVRAILASQTSREARLQRADDVIRNEGTLEDLSREVARLHRRYSALGADTTSGTRR